MALSKLALALAVAPSAALVAPSAKVSSTKLSAEGKLDEIPEDTNRFTSRLATQEGFCLDLPGALAPMGQWDPAGFTSEASDNDIRRYREAETQHGRVAMLAVIGFLVAESWHPLFADVTGPAIDHLTQVRQEYPAFFEIGALVIGGLEVNRALVGWAFPDSREKAGLLNEDYYPGDVGFDPLGLKPTDPTAGMAYLDTMRFASCPSGAPTAKLMRLPSQASRPRSYCRLHSTASMTCVSVKVNRYSAYHRSLRPPRYAKRAHATQPQAAATSETLRFQHIVALRRRVGGVRGGKGNYP